MQLTGKEAAVAESPADLCCDIRTARVLKLQHPSNTYFDAFPVTHRPQRGLGNSLERRRRLHPFDALGSILPRQEGPTIDSPDRQVTRSGTHNASMTGIVRAGVGFGSSDRSFAQSRSLITATLSRGRNG
eukprot:15463879-Alexandrium_andersonii.AAC.1